MTWNDLKKVWKKLNTPETNQEARDPLADLANSLQMNLSPIERESLLRMSLQKEPPVTFAQDAMETDGINNMKSNGTEYAPDIIFTHFAKQGFIGFAACAILKQNWIINNACNIPGQDAIRPGYELSVKEENQLSTEEIDDFKSISLKKYQILEICARAVEKKKVFGSALVVPLFNCDYDYSVPYNPESIKPNSYKGMVVVEPFWLQFEFNQDALQNPLSPYFYNPTWFKLSNGIRIHSSHCIFLKNTVVPDILKPTYYYGGIPLTQMIYQRVYAAERVANEAPMLALSKRLLVADLNISSFLKNSQEIKDKCAALSYMRDNFGVAVKRTGDNIQQIDTNLSDFDALIMTQYQLVAAIAQMPATKLLKAQPTGLNATGEYDFKDYVQSLQTIQDNDMKPIIDRHNELLSISMGKKIDFTTTFNPIDVPSKSDLAQINSLKAQTLSALVQSGILAQEEARESLRSDEDTDFNSLQGNTESPEEQQEIQQLLEKMKAGETNKLSTNNLTNASATQPAQNNQQENNSQIIQKSVNETEK